MRCHSCGGEPIGVCRFCGRAVCDDCHSQMPFVLTVYVGEAKIPKAIVVADALWCGACRPEPEPIPMPEIY